MNVFQKALLAAGVVALGYGPASGQAQTQLSKGAGEYEELFSGTKKLLLESEHVKSQKLGGKERRVFVPWIRDHVHVMKAMKYFEKDISSFWEFFMQNQTAEGLYFDYFYPLSSPLRHRTTLFEQRYWKLFPDEGLQMHRLPVEADLEYLMVEGAYYIWQATGDTRYLQPWLDDLEQGMQYAMRDSLRWSKKSGLVKRGYTLDTWDFMQLPTSRDEYVRSGKDVQEGIFDIDADTPMGIMHGDNSGMYAASRQLAQLYTALGNGPKAGEWTRHAEHFRRRTNEVCWNGKYYAHFVEEDPMPAYLKIDQRNTLSLSNPYDVNRGLPTEEMAASIIASYQALKGNNKLDSFAEWFGVYPPVEPHFADFKPGSYMNGGVNTIVGGELAKAALQHGFEAYGVDILNRTLALMRKHGGKLPVSYKPDGTVDEGIPDNWGQAAVMSALLEGLAGVTDGGELFKRVEVAPRWLAAGKAEVDVTVAYAPSGKAVTYAYRHQAGAKKLTLSLSGDPDGYVAKLLLPEGAKPARVTLDGKTARPTLRQVRNSSYVEVAGIPKGRHTVEVVYQ